MSIRSFNSYQGFCDVVANNGSFSIIMRCLSKEGRGRIYSGTLYGCNRDVSERVNDAVSFLTKGIEKDNPQISVTVYLDYDPEGNRLAAKEVAKGQFIATPCFFV